MIHWWTRTIMTWRVVEWYAQLLTFFQLSLPKRYAAILYRFSFLGIVWVLYRNLCTFWVWKWLFELLILTYFPLTFVDTSKGFPTFWKHPVRICRSLGIHKRFWRITSPFETSLYSSQGSTDILIWVHSSYERICVRVSFWFFCVFRQFYQAVIPLHDFPIPRFGLDHKLADKQFF